jgi:hypothetical protein
MSNRAPKAEASPCRRAAQPSIPSSARSAATPANASQPFATSGSSASATKTAAPPARTRVIALP